MHLKLDSLKRKDFQQTLNNSGGASKGVIKLTRQTPSEVQWLSEEQWAFSFSSVLAGNLHTLHVAIC